jgi:hypothetical protein
MTRWIRRLTWFGVLGIAIAAAGSTIAREKSARGKNAGSGAGASRGPGGLASTFTSRFASHAAPHDGSHGAPHGAPHSVPEWPPIKIADDFADLEPSPDLEPSAIDMVETPETPETPANPDTSAPEHDGRWVAPEKGACPTGFPVKANDSSRIFHVPGGRFYDRTVPERCYANADDAAADGYRAAKA